MCRRLGLGLLGIAGELLGDPGVTVVRRLGHDQQVVVAETERVLPVVLAVLVGAAEGDVVHQPAGIAVHEDVPPHGRPDGAVAGAPRRLVHVLDAKGFVVHQCLLLVPVEGSGHDHRCYGPLGLRRCISRPPRLRLGETWGQKR